MGWLVNHSQPVDCMETNKKWWLRLDSSGAEGEVTWGDLRAFWRWIRWKAMIIVALFALGMGGCQVMERLSVRAGGGITATVELLQP